jgi:2-oxoglutarate ferredoxin oxidoreductase subunit beta
VDRPSYDELMASQLEQARSGGPGDLTKLIAGNDTWEVV